MFFKDGVGDPLFAMAYLEGKGISLPLVDFRHSRFKIIFKDAGGVYYLKGHIINYLNTKDSLIFMLNLVL